MSAPTELVRFTTRYDPLEDRFCLIGAGTGRTQADCQVWLTARLLGRLLPVLLDGLDRPAAGGPGWQGRAEQRFAQQVARLSQPALPPLLATADETAGPQAPRPGGWLAAGVHLQRSPEEVRLVFRAATPDPRQALLRLSPQLLRQWLNIVHDGWRDARWPPDLWPDWMTAAPPPPPPGPPSAPPSR